MLLFGRLANSKSPLFHIMLFAMIALELSIIPNDRTPLLFAIVEFVIIIFISSITRPRGSPRLIADP